MYIINPLMCTYQEGSFTFRICHDFSLFILITYGWMLGHQRVNYWAYITSLPYSFNSWMNFFFITVNIVNNNNNSIRNDFFFPKSFKELIKWVVMCNDLFLGAKAVMKLILSLKGKKYTNKQNSTVDMWSLSVYRTTTTNNPEIARFCRLSDYRLFCIFLVNFVNYARLSVCRKNKCLFILSTQLIAW